MLVFYGYVRYWLDEYKGYILRRYAYPISIPEQEVIIARRELDFQKFCYEQTISSRFLDSIGDQFSDFVNRAKKDILIRLILSVDGKFIEWDEEDISDDYEKWRYDVGKRIRAAIYLGRFVN